jgi:hypothetical protein
MSSKRGASHIEVIVAFVLFIGFLIFALFFFNPLDSSRVLESTRYYTMDEVTDKLSVDLESYSVSLINLDGNEYLIPITSDIENVGVRAERPDGTKLIASYEPAGVNVNLDGARFIKIYFSRDFDDDETNSYSILPSENFIISSSDERKILSEKEAKMLGTYYENDYVALKEEFNLGGRVDFSYSLTFSDRDSVEAERAIPEGFEVLVEKDRVEVIGEDGKIIFADLSVKVW